MTEALPYLEYHSLINQTSNGKPSIFVGLSRIVLGAKLLTSNCHTVHFL
ncbi:hypothetical protein CPS_1314 [Colwellia psychrerythraea 34H]|uniref:Uncharacterized protein n=1 Tax=Colwellia psychrerythraea (strain 34H / ATCC BAA-681) TaxID=167879 RepID=Q486F8_COLP3|nr:hypothetical protein CPS_1314 [Colwellia psychrerythraea 34H]